MTYGEAEKLSKRWGEKPCHDPRLAEETPITGQRTGDYYCDQCGAGGVGRNWNKKPTKDSS